MSLDPRDFSTMTGMTFDQFLSDVEEIDEGFCERHKIPIREHPLSDPVEFDRNKFTVAKARKMMPKLWKAAPAEVKRYFLMEQCLRLSIALRNAIDIYSTEHQHPDIDDALTQSKSIIQKLINVVVKI